MRELALVFLRLGATAFGGPAAHIAMMEDEVVRRRGWLTREAFLDLLAATNLIPGPNSTEMAIHIGRLRAGWKGLLVAGACFILPATVITGAIAWAYVRYGAVPEAAGLLYGVKAVVLAVVLQALGRLGRGAVRTPGLAALAAVAVAANALGLHELLVLLAGGLFVVAARVRPPRATVPSVLPLFLFFVKTGSVLFGSGYVLLAFLRADLVERWHWLTEQQLLDAVAVGQVTPGPVFSTATFLGYVLGGASGALVATVGIFLPAFVFVALSAPLVPRLRASRTMGAFLDGVVVASLALMAVVTWRLGRAAVVDVPSALLVLLAAGLLWRRVNSAWLVLGGGAAGLLLDWLR